MLKGCCNRSNAGPAAVLIRQLGSLVSDSGQVPVIRIPRYMEQSIGNAIYKEHRKVKEVKAKQAARDKTPLEAKHINKLIISSNGDKRLNHYYGFRYDVGKGSEIPLISKKWTKRATVGQQMTFHQFDVNPSLLEVNSASLADQEAKTFAALGLNEHLIAAINQSVNGSCGSGSKKSSSVTPSSIQFGVIPLILQRRNVIFSAETGSGKTVAYLAPIIQLIQEQKALDLARSGGENYRRRSPYGLVVLPSRELTEQVGGVARELAENTGVGVATMIGGVPVKGDEVRRHTGLDLVVTTSGMIESHLNRGIYHLHRLQHVVLDEADTLLDDTFSYEVVDLLENLNLKSSESAEVLASDDEEDGGFQNLPGTQLICASATLPTTLDSTLGGLLNLAEDVEKVTTKALHNLHSNVRHRFLKVGKYDRESRLMELLAEDRLKRRPTIIFSNRTDAANWIYHTLRENDFSVVRLTAAMAEEERLHAFRSFQAGERDILVATDLGSRGLDTTRVRHVINYDTPHYVSDYIHRAGRVGRLGSENGGGGLVTSLVAFKPEAYMVMELERALRLGVEIQSMNANIKAQVSQRRADKRSKAMRDEA